MPLAHSHKQIALHRRPLGERIAQDIRDKIQRGHYSAGALLPSRKALAVDFEVSLVTVEQAIKSLVADGWVRTEPGRGTFVVDEPPLGAKPSDLPFAGHPARPAYRQEPLGPVAPVLCPEIGLIVDTDLWNDTVRDGQSHYNVASSLERSLCALGARSTIKCLQDPEGARVHTRMDVARQLIDSGVDALVFIGVTYWDAASLMDILEPLRLPCVMVDGNNIRTSALSVCYDNRDAGYQAGRHLIRRGCERFLFFSSVNDQWVRDRLDGARDAVALAGMPLSALNASVLDIEPHMPPFITHGPRWQESRAYELARELLKDGLSSQGVIADNDRAAYGFLQAAEEVGLLAGRDFAIIGFDNLPRSMRSGLTSLSPPYDAMGREAARLVMDALSGDLQVRRVCLNCDLIVRASTDSWRGTK